jgi:hypothetical protein
LTKPLKEYAQQVLAERDRGHKIHEAFQHANGRVKVLGKNTTWRRTGTRRALFWEAAVDKLIELVADDDGVQVIEHHDTVSFVFDDAVLVRLKKASMDLRTSNYPTPTAELFHDHQADLFGYLGLQRVEAVYIPNQFETDIIWSGVVARDNDADLWHFELTPAVAAPAVALPRPVTPPASDLAKVKNQAKGATQKKSDDGKR